MNPHVPPFDHLSVRRALNLAVDRDEVAKLISNATSIVNTPTCQVLPPGLAGYRPDCPYTADPTPSGIWSAPDVKRAKRLVRASGTQRTPIALWELAGAGDVVAVTRYLTGVLRQIGYDHVSVHVTSNGQKYSDLLFGRHTRAQAGYYAWVPDYPNPAAFFVPLLTCPAPGIPAAEANTNAFEFCDRHLDHLVDAAATAQATNPALAVTLWRQADQEAVTQAAWVPLTNQVGTDVIGPRVGNYQHNPQWGALLDQLWVK